MGSLTDWAAAGASGNRGNPSDWGAGSSWSGATISRQIGGAESPPSRHTAWLGGWLAGWLAERQAGELQGCAVTSMSAKMQSLLLAVSASVQGRGLSRLVGGGVPAGTAGCA